LCCLYSCHSLPYDCSFLPDLFTERRWAQASALGSLLVNLGREFAFSSDVVFTCSR
jgi:hypothetical protein